MPIHRRALALVPFVAILSACAVVRGIDPVRVQVVDVQPLPGEGLELRFLCKLRVQNPNDMPITYDGIYLELEVRGSTFATGISNASGTVPRYGEVVLSVPIAASALHFARQVMSFFMSGDRGRIDYVLRGKINGPVFSAVRFASKGEITLPSEMLR
jgi:LEA14-like dessication related protein